MTRGCCHMTPARAEAIQASSSRVVHRGSQHPPEHDLMRLSPLALALLPLLLAACASTPDREPDEVRGADPCCCEPARRTSSIAEAFVTALTPKDNIDSPGALARSRRQDLAVRHGQGRQGPGACTTATPAPRLRSVGTAAARRRASCQAPERHRRHRRPLRVRGRARQPPRADASAAGLHWPRCSTFGDDELQQPYGLWVRRHGSGELEVLVTDAYMVGEDAKGDDIVPPLAELDRRVRRYLVRVDGDGRDGASTAVPSATPRPGRHPRARIAVRRRSQRSPADRGGGRGHRHRLPRLHLAGDVTAGARRPGPASRRRPRASR